MSGVELLIAIIEDENITFDTLEIDYIVVFRRSITEKLCLDYSPVFQMFIFIFTFIINTF
jgi:hypothetical protein